MLRSCVYMFDGFTVDADNRALYRDGTAIRLPPKIFATLLYLVERPNQIIAKEELITAVWGGANIETGGIARNISALRSALDSNDHDRYIVTVAKRGYKFCATVHESSTATDSVPIQSLATGTVINRTNNAPAPKQAEQTRTWMQKLIGGQYPILIGLSAVVLATAFVIPTKLDWSDYSRRQLTSNSPDLPIATAAISPDGKALAYTELDRVYIAVIGSAERKLLPTPANTLTGNIEWYPDNKHLLLSSYDVHQHRSMIWTSTIDGTESHEIKSNATNARLSNDGTQICYIHNRSQLWIANSDGSNARQIATTTARSQFALLPHFSPSGEYILTARKDSVTSRTMVEARHIKSGATITLFITDHYVADFIMLPSNQLFISEATRLGSQIISTPVDLVHGTHGANHTIGSWAIGTIARFSASADGRRVTVINDQSQSDVYVADLQSGGTALANIERLTLDDRNDRPAGWWNDNRSVLFYSNRHDTFGIYRQSRDQANAETLISDAKDNTWPILTPDGQWLLYFSSAPSAYEANAQVSLMRKPTAGGPAELIDTRPDLYRSIRCARVKSVCVIAEHSIDESIFYKFDAEQGRGKEIARAPWSPGADFYDWDISPDASRIAYVDTANNGSNISFISLSDNPATSQLNIPGFEQLSTLSWDAAGKGFFISSHEASNESAPLVLLHVGLDGNVSVLRHQLNSAEGWAMPSPDGHQLAYQQWTLDGNVWLLER